MLKKIIGIVFVLFVVKLSAQTSVNFQGTTLVLNPFSNINSDIYKQKIIESGAITIEPGILFSLEMYNDPWTSFKITQGFQLDACSKFAAMTQLLIRKKFFQSWKHSMSGGIGPAVHYRQSWTDNNQYIDEGYYTTSGNFQYKISWLSAELEYNYMLSKFGELSVSAIHIHPQSFCIAIGYKYWIDKDAKKRNCISCPSFR